MTAPMFITDLSHEQLRKVLAVNTELKESVKIDSYIWQTVRIGKILTYFKDTLSDYAISSYGSNYLSVNRNKIDSFIIGVRTANDTHAFLTDENSEILQRVEKDIALALDMPYANVDYIQLYAHIHSDLAHITKTISQQFESMLAESHTEDALFAHLCDMYITNAIPNAYIKIDDNGNSDFVLHQKITRRYNKINPEMSVSA